MSRTVLLTLGRLPPAIDIARSFAAAGWRVLVAEPFPWHLARTSRAVSACVRVPSPVENAAGYRAAIAELCARESVDLVVPVSEETPHVCALGGALTVFADSQTHVLALHSKLGFIHRAAALALPVPATARIDTARAAEIAATGRYIVKPEFSCSGRGLSLHAAGEPLPARRGHGWAVQRRLDGEHVSSFAIARDGEVLALVAYRGLVNFGSVAVCFERIEHAAVERWTRAFVEGTAHTGFIAFDFIDADGEPRAIECNPRATSGVHFLATADIAPAVLGERVARPRPEKRLQEGYSCWTATLASLGDGPARRHNWSCLRSARDVTWSRGDPWVFVLMMFSTWRIIWRAIRRRRPFAEVLSLDIEWTGAHPPESTGAAGHAGNR